MTKSSAPSDAADRYSDRTGVLFLHALPLDGPVVYVTGDADVAPGPESSARQAALARNGRLHVIEHCGHYVPMERPDELNAILCDVIREVE